MTLHVTLQLTPPSPRRLGPAVHVVPIIFETMYLVLPVVQEICIACLRGHSVFLQESVFRSRGVDKRFHMNGCILGTSQAKIGIVGFENPNLLQTPFTNVEWTL